MEGGGCGRTTSSRRGVADSKSPELPPGHRGPGGSSLLVVCAPRRGAPRAGVKGSMQSGVEGVNRPAKQTRPISARFCPDPGTFGFFPGTSGKMHLGVFSWSFRVFVPLSNFCG
jgi:hypothetical protein